LVFFFAPARLHLITLWTALVYSAFAILYSSSDTYVYLVPDFLCFAIWIGLGAAGLIGLARRVSSWLGWGTVLVLLLYFAGLAALHWRGVDASHDLRAEAFGSQVLAAAPAHALVFAQGDRAVFALWYFHFALRQRPDLSVLATDLLSYDWYQETVRFVYPSLVLPGSFPWPETVVESNPSLPVCYVGYDGQAIIDCMPAPAD
jgi:hypothetical protein